MAEEIYDLTHLRDALAHDEHSLVYFGFSQSPNYSTFYDDFCELSVEHQEVFFFVVHGDKIPVAAEVYGVKTTCFVAFEKEAKVCELTSVREVVDYVERRHLK